MDLNTFSVNLKLKFSLLYLNVSRLCLSCHVNMEFSCIYIIINQFGFKGQPGYLKSFKDLLSIFYCNNNKVTA